tara:strand:+ start:16298 stop:16447 length:150 start_codon:yes stop_codon:yes gene_type:complete
MIEGANFWSYWSYNDGAWLFLPSVIKKMSGKIISGSWEEKSLPMRCPVK